MSIKSEQLEWRRGKVIELRAIGLSYAEIARELQVPKTSVAEDMLSYVSRLKNPSGNTLPSIYLSNIRYVLALWIQYSKTHL